jgi:hypothetical protein
MFLRLVRIAIQVSDKLAEIAANNHRAGGARIHPGERLPPARIEECRSRYLTG